MKKFIITCLIFSTTAVAEFNVGILTGLNLTNGNLETLRARDSSRFNRTTYNLKSFSIGTCAGYDYFFNSLMLGTDISWLHNKKKWHEINQTPSGLAGILDGYETISIKPLSQYSAGIRIGYLSEKFLPYVRLGIEKVRFNIRLLTVDPINNTSNTYQKSITKLTASTALGFEYKTYDNFWLRFEGRYINSKSYRMNYRSHAYASNARIRISSRRILLTAGIIYRF